MLLGVLAMTPAEAFNHPRHRESEDCVFRAERMARAGDTDGARKLYRTAAEAELEVAQIQTAAQPRGVLAVSAATCFLQARCWADAMRVSHTFLAQPEALIPDAAAALESVLDDALRLRDLHDALGPDALVAPLEIKLDGGRVRRGVCPSSLVQVREEIAEALVYRVADLKAQRAFRKAGRSVTAKELEIYRLPARAASYGIRLFLATPPQSTIPGVAVSPAEIVRALLELAAVAVTDGLEGVSAVVGERQYTNAIVRAFRDLAPDGTAVGTVSFGAPWSPVVQRPVRFTATQRSEFNLALHAAPPDDRFDLEGTLKAVSLRRSRYIVVDGDDGGSHRLRIRGGALDDTIGPKLNRVVRVSGKRIQEKDGTVSFWADDVVLVEDGEVPTL